MQKKTYLALLALSLALPATPLTAAETPADDYLLMEEVVVTAGRVEQSTARIPATVSVITAEQIQESGARSVPDVLRSLPGVWVSDLNGNGVNQSVDMGGFGESASQHVAVLVDGRRLNPIDRDNVRWANISLDQVERIEVLHGSGAVLYGDNAMGGVINIITKEAEPGTSVQGALLFGSHGMNKEQGSVNVQQGRGRMYLEYVRQDSDGYRERSASEQESVFGKASLDLDDQTYLWFDLSFVSAEYQFPGPLSADEMAADPRQAGNPLDEGADDSLSLVLGVKKELKNGGRLSAHLGHQQEERESDMLSFSMPSYMIFDVETLSFNMQYAQDHKMAGYDNQFVMGLDHYDVEYDAWQGATKGARSNTFDNSKQTLGLYLKDDLSLTPDVLLSAGARYEKPEIDLQVEALGATNTHKMDDDEWAWDLGLSYLMEDGAKVYGRMYRSFRYPVVDDFTTIYGGAINTALKQETALGYEAGLYWPLGKKASLDLRLYQMDVDDEIAWNEDTWLNENMDETRHTGVEVSLRYRPLEMLEVYGGIAYTRAEFRAGTNDGNNVPQAPDWKGNIGLQIDPVRDLKINLLYNYVGERYFGGDYSNTQDQMDSYQTVDLSLRYQYSEKVTLLLNGANIFNEKYADIGWSGSYYPMPEAVYSAGVQVKF